MYLRAADEVVCVLVDVVCRCVVSRRRSGGQADRIGAGEVPRANRTDEEGEQTPLESAKADWETTSTRTDQSSTNALIKAKAAGKQIA